MPFLTPFFGWEGSPTKIDYRKKGALIPTSLLEDPVAEVKTDFIKGGYPSKRRTRFEKQ